MNPTVPTDRSIAAISSGLEARAKSRALRATIQLVRSGVHHSKEKWKEVYQSREDIELAKEIVKLRYHISLDDAFEWIRKTSNKTNIPVKEIAWIILRRGTRVPNRIIRNSE